ncbi:MAG: antitoxin VapB family protein [Planctomycetales bacterium]
MIRKIELDDDAYDRLEQARRSAETHSEVIRRYMPRKRSVDEILEVLRKAPLSDETLEAIDESVSRRRSTPRRHRN